MIEVENLQLCMPTTLTIEKHGSKIVLCLNKTLCHQLYRDDVKLSLKASPNFCKEFKKSSAYERIKQQTIVLKVEQMTKSVFIVKQFYGSHTW